MKKETTNMAYDRPEIEVINFKAESVICNSPGAGEGEGTGEDDWGEGGNG